MPMTFTLDADQEIKLAEWCRTQDEAVLAEQRKSDDPFIREEAEAGFAYYGAIGGELTYSFSPTSIGTVLVVKHSVTGEEINLTDYGSW